METQAAQTRQIGVSLEGGFDRLFSEQWSKLVRCICRMVQCKETAADIAQEAYLRVVESANQSAIVTPQAFLFRIAKNLAIDHLRKQRSYVNQAATLDHAVDVPSVMPSLERMVMDKQRFSAFLSAVDDLPPRCREAFILHRMHELSYGEIAARLRISESGVEKNIMRALAHCRRALQKLAAN